MNPLNDAVWQLESIPRALVVEVLRQVHGEALDALDAARCASKTNTAEVTEYRYGDAGGRIRAVARIAAALGIPIDEVRA